MLQAIVIQHTVIDPFARSTFAVDGFVLFRIPGDAGMETQVSMVFYVDSASIAAGGTLFFIRTGADAPAPERAAVFMRIFDRVVSPGAHFMPCPAKRMAFLVKSNITRCIFRSFGTAVNINEGIDIPPFQQFISRYIVMGGIKADIFRENPIGIASKIIYGIKEIFAVMALCTGKLHEKWNFCFQFIVSAAEHIQGMSEIPCFFAAVPSPFCIGVRVMAAACVPVWAGMPAGRKVPAIG